VVGLEARQTLDVLEAHLAPVVGLEARQAMAVQVVRQAYLAHHANRDPGEGSR
jgi:uncharacterized protein (DUF2237 family)